jgi:hypothetical protein
MMRLARSSTTSARCAFCLAPLTDKLAKLTVASSSGEVVDVG